MIYFRRTILKLLWLLLILISSDAKAGTDRTGWTKDIGEFLESKNLESSRYSSSGDHLTVASIIELYHEKIGNKIHLFQIGSGGEIKGVAEWTPGDSNARVIIEGQVVTANGETWLFVLTPDRQVIKFDEKLEFLKLLPSPLDRRYGIKSIQTLVNGHFLVAGSKTAEDAHAWAAEIDQELNVIWEKEYSEKGFFIEANQLADGNYVLLGNISDQGQPAKEVFLSIVDPQGAVLKHTFFSGRNGSITVLPRGFSVIYDKSDDDKYRYYLKLYNTDLQEIWERPIKEQKTASDEFPCYLKSKAIWFNDKLYVLFPSEMGASIFLWNLEGEKQGDFEYPSSLPSFKWGFDSSADGLFIISSPTNIAKDGYPVSVVRVAKFDAYPTPSDGESLAP